MVFPRKTHPKFLVIFRFEGDGMPHVTVLISVVDLRMSQPHHTFIVLF